MSKELEQLKQEYLNDPVEFLRIEKQELDGVGGPPVQKVVFIDDNEIFVRLCGNLNFFNDKGLPMHESEVSVIHSKVEEVVYISNRICFGFPNQMAQITLTPENDGICISKVILNPNMEHKPGTGSGLMYMFYWWLLTTLEELPPMYLECMGHINWGDKLIQYPYSRQTKFFRKFGFRVIEYRKGNEKYGESDYGQMKFFPDKFDFSKVTSDLMTKMG